MRPFPNFPIAICALISLAAGCDSSKAVDPLAPPDEVVAARAASSELGAPTMKAGASYSASRIDVSWFDNSTQETSFEIHRSTSGAAGAFTLVATTAADVVSYADRAVDARVENCYRVRALRVTGKKTAYSTFSNTICGPFYPSAPNAPTGVTATAASESLINLAWQDNSDNESGFQIERGGATFRTAANVASHADGTVMPVTNYCYTIRAVNTLVIGGSTLYGYSTATAPVCATTPPESAPPASSYVITANPEDSRTSRLTVEWTGSSVPPSFRIYRSTDNSTTWTAINPPGLSHNVFYDSPVATEQQVCYRVAAYNTAGEAQPSSASCMTPPAGATNMAGTAVDAETLELTWTDNSGVEDGYLLYIHHEGGSPDNAGWSEWAELVAELPPNSTSTRAARLVPDLYITSHYYVVAKNDGGISSASGMVPATGPTP